jgi:hypothetical protein
MIIECTAFEAIALLAFLLGGRFVSDMVVHGLSRNHDR